MPDKKDKLCSWYEKWYPAIFSWITLFLYIFLLANEKSNNTDNILDAVINFASILLGFLGAFVALIFSLLDTDIMKMIFDSSNYKRRLERFFLRSCQSGFLVVGLSIMLFARNSMFSMFEKQLVAPINICAHNAIKYLWVFSVAYFTFSSYRIISLMIKIVFNAPSRKSGIVEMREEEKEQDVELQKLRKKYEK